MKTILDITKAIGSDGGQVEGAIVINGQNLEAGVKLSYPASIIVDAITKPLEPLRLKLEKLIPGDWDNPIIDKLFEDAKAEVLSLLTE